MDITKEAFTTFAKLIGDEYIDKLPEQFNDLKKFLNKVNIYGSVENPLFIAREVQKALERPEHFRKRDFDNSYLTMCIEKKVKYKGQVRNILFLTDHGVHQILSTHRGDNAQQFRNYVFLALKLLHKNKQTSLTQVVESAQYNSKNKEKIFKNYENQITKLQKKVEGLNGRICEAQLEYNDVTDELDEYKQQARDYKYTTTVQNEQIVNLISNLKYEKENNDPYNPTIINKFDQMKQLYWEKIYIFLLPSDACDKICDNRRLFNYNYLDHDAETISYNDVMLYAINKDRNNNSLKCIDAKMVLDLYVSKPVDNRIANIRQYMKEIINPKTYKYKKMLVYHTSLGRIMEAFETLENTILNNNKWSKDMSIMKSQNRLYETRWGNK